jgi:hypothetical protein
MKRESDNLMELGFPPEVAKRVEEAAALYKAAYVDTIDTVFKIAKAIDDITEYYYGSGVRGSLAQALIQHGFTARDPDKEIDKAIRSKLKEMLEEEAKVRSWWVSVKAQKKKYWTSAKTIYDNWKRDTKPVDPDADNRPKRETPLQRERATNQLLQQQLHEVRDLLKTADGGNLFTANSSADHIADAVAGLMRTSPSKMRAIATRLNKLAKEYEKRGKEAQSAKKSARVSLLKWRSGKPFKLGGKTFQNHHADVGGGALYSISVGHSFPAMKFTGYSIAYMPHGTVTGQEQLADNLKSVEQAKQVAQAHYNRAKDDASKL